MASHRAQRPEREDAIINDLAITQALAGKFVSGVGYLALTWSTVVLLGGFVGALQTKEFWFLIAVSLVLASTILDIYDYDFDILEVVLSSLARLDGPISSDVGCPSPCCLQIPSALVLSLTDAVFIINTYGPVATVVISMMRLIQHDYDGSDAANNGNLRAALFLFYGLALLHGMCSLGWFVLHVFRIEQLDVVSKRYGFDDKWGQKVLREYFKETKLKYAKGLRLPASWNLVAYAVGLLDSVSLDDTLSGVRMLDTFVAGKTKRCIRPELLSSRRAIQNLINMLGWASSIPDVEEMRERATRIIADISSELRIAQFPGALQCVSSLLNQEALGSEQSSPSSDAGTTQEDTTTDQCTQWISQLPWKLLMWVAGMRGKKEKAFEPKGTRELILQGLRILKRLAYDEHNCREIVNTPGLLSKITAPITSQAFLDADGYGDTWVSRLRRKAGEALARLLSTESASGLDHQLPKQDVINLLTKIIDIILSMEIERKPNEVAGSGSVNITDVESAGAVTGAGGSNDSVIGIDQANDDEQSDEGKLVAALLSLTVVICHKLIDANDFCSVVPAEGELIKKLKDIIDRNNDTTADCLRIVKFTCQVVIAMMKLKPSCIEEFNKHNFKEVLSDLNNRMLFASNDRELTKLARSLASLVKEAHQLFNKAQEPASGGPGGGGI